MGDIKKKDLISKSVSELKKIYVDLIEEYRSVRFTKVMGGGDEKLISFRTYRKNIARIKTLINEYNLKIRN